MIFSKLFGNKGILGINARNLHYLKAYNPKKAIKIADDKIKTKQFLSARGVSVPKLYAILKQYSDLDNFNLNSLPATFVIKPNNGYGGEGIIPIVGKKGTNWVTSGGKELSKKQILSHIREIIDGTYSISNVRDIAFIEQLIISEDSLAKYSYKGLPDIRVVVHNLIPVMAMLRLPTRESDGKANLHLGAVGVGIDIAKGIATHISYKNRILEELPDNLGPIKGYKIPYWDEILMIASRSQLITNLGYLAADIAIDKNSGPVLLELNARAGLGVQIANLAPLRKRLQRIEGVKVTNPSKGVRIAKDMFGNVIEKEILNLSGKQLIKTKENIEIILKKEKVKVRAQVNTSKQRSIIDEKLATKLGLLEDTSKYDDEKSILKMKFSLKGKRIQTIVDVEEIPSKEIKFILGGRDLTDFLIDTSIDEKRMKFTPANTDDKEIFIQSKVSIDYEESDRTLALMDRKIKLLYHLRPKNLEEVKEKFQANPTFNPIFEYPELSFDELEIIDTLNKIKTDDSPIGKLFNRKKIDILDKIKLLTSIDTEEFTENSINCFGKPTQQDVELAKTQLLLMKDEENKQDPRIYSAEEAKEKFEAKLKEYNITKWKVKIKDSLVTSCVIGKTNAILLKDTKYSRDKIENLIVHEIETHLLTAENGKEQPYKIFNRGFEDYLSTQEGLAIYNIEKQRKKLFINNFKILSYVVAIDLAFTKSFLEIYNILRDEYKLPPNSAWGTALKVKRGICNTKDPGSFTKDIIYYNGYLEVKKFIEDGGDYKDLYLGKFNIKDIDTIKAINNIVPPRYLPNWINTKK